MSKSKFKITQFSISSCLIYFARGYGDYNNTSLKSYHLFPLLSVSHQSCFLFFFFNLRTIPSSPHNSILSPKPEVASGTLLPLHHYSIFFKIAKKTGNEYPQVHRVCRNCGNSISLNYSWESAGLFCSFHTYFCLLILVL